MSATNVKREMQPLQSVLPAVVGQILKSGPMSTEKMNFAWRTAVGPALARVTTVRLEASGVLVVTASDERWRRELHRSRSTVVARVQSLLGPGSVTRIEVLSGNLRNTESRIPNSDSQLPSPESRAPSPDKRRS